MSQTPEAPAKTPLHRRWRRPLLLAGPLIVLAVAAWIYVFGGRYISTDDAYVKSDMVNVSADVSGPITEVLVRENQVVARGTPLLKIDRRPYEVALQEARARLEQTRLDIASLRATYEQKQSALASARSDLEFQVGQQKRVRELYARHVLSQAALDSAHRDLSVARNHVNELQHDASEALAKLDGNPDLPIESHPAWMTAKAAFDKAQLDLERTTVRAPIDGVASKVPQPGAYAMPALPLLSLVSDKDAWIEANYKESELEGIRPGQPVEISVDAYSNHEWSGEVASIGQATGAEFSLLPAQNASGNWVKVVQRVPVRIHINHTGNEPSLRAGMSVEVSVDTGRNPRGAHLLALIGVSPALASDR